MIGSGRESVGEVEVEEVADGRVRGMAGGQAESGEEEKGESVGRWGVAEWRLQMRK